MPPAQLLPSAVCFCPSALGCLLLPFCPRLPALTVTSPHALWSVSVVQGSGCRVRKHIVRRRHLSKALPSVVGGVHIRVQLQHQLAVGGFELGLRRGGGHTQQVVVTSIDDAPAAAGRCRAGAAAGAACAATAAGAATAAAATAAPFVDHLLPGAEPRLLLGGTCTGTNGVAGASGAICQSRSCHPAAVHGCFTI